MPERLVLERADGQAICRNTRPACSVKGSTLSGLGDLPREIHPVKVGPGESINHGLRESLRRLGEGAEPKIPEEGPLMSPERADLHGGSA